MTENAFRRWFGLSLGLALGLAYGAVSQGINHAVLPGIPFWQPPLGPVGNTLLSSAVGALLGLVAAWPERSWLGMLASAATGAILVLVVVMLTGDRAAEVLPAKTAVSACIFGPVAAMLTPLVVLLRWASNWQVIARLDRLPLWRRAGLPLLLILVAAGLGMLSLLPARARPVVLEMNAIVQAAQQAPDRASLPAPYQAIGADGYPEQVRGPYTLDYEEMELNRFAIPRPLDSEFDQKAVLARLPGGTAFVCIFVPGEEVPRCMYYPRWPIAGE